MKILFFLILLGINSAAAVIHSLKYFLTGSSGIPNFPEFVVVGMVDEVQMFYYDSTTRRAEPKQVWMNQVTADYPQYWERETDASLGTQQTFKANIDIAKQRFNQTEGVHVLQKMIGCQWDDQTGEINGFYQFGYDGEDFIAFDLKTETWTAPNPQAEITKQKWDRSKAYIAQRKNYLAQVCPKWVKKYLNYGKSSLLRTDRPSVCLLQTSPSSPVSCHATGFYPDRATMFWRKDGEETHEDVDHGEILPNHDGTFQMTVDLRVKAEDLEKYECVFHLSGLKNDIITKLDKAEIRTNKGSLNSWITLTAVIAGVGTLLLLVICITRLIFKRLYKEPKSTKLSELSSRSLNISQSLRSVSGSSSSSDSSLDSADSNTPLTKGTGALQEQSDSFLTVSYREQCVDHIADAEY